MTSKSVANISSLQKQPRKEDDANEAKGPAAGSTNIEKLGAQKSDSERPKTFNSSLLNYKPKVGVSKIMKT